MQVNHAMMGTKINSMAVPSLWSLDGYARLGRHSRSQMILPLSMRTLTVKCAIQFVEMDVWSRVKSAMMAIQSQGMDVTSTVKLKEGLVGTAWVDPLYHVAPVLYVGMVSAKAMSNVTMEIGKMVMAAALIVKLRKASYALKDGSLVVDARIWANMNRSWQSS